jgi:hypothetical protein
VNVRVASASAEDLLDPTRAMPAASYLHAARGGVTLMSDDIDELASAYRMMERAVERGGEA